MNKEEQFAELILEKTRSGVIKWNLAEKREPGSLIENFAFYCARIKGDEGLSLMIGKKIGMDNSYILIAAFKDSPFMVLFPSEMENKYTLKALFDSASGDVNESLIDRFMGTINNEKPEPKSDE